MKRLKDFLNVITESKLSDIVIYENTRYVITTNIEGKDANILVYIVKNDGKVVTYDQNGIDGGTKKESLKAFIKNVQINAKRSIKARSGLSWGTRGPNGQYEKGEAENVINGITNKTLARKDAQRFFLEITLPGDIGVDTTSSDSYDAIIGHLGKTLKFDGFSTKGLRSLMFMYGMSDGKAEGDVDIIVYNILPNEISKYKSRLQAGKFTNIKSYTDDPKKS